MTQPELPQTLTLYEGFRAAFYMILRYQELESAPSEALVLLTQYMWTDPARWDDWQQAARRALGDGGEANPDHEGSWRDRGAWPTPPEAT